jgi:hypothetical protein
MNLKRTLPLAAVLGASILLAGCSANTGVTSATPKASASAAANACGKAIIAKLPADLVDPASCVVVPGITGDSSALSPQFASGKTVAFVKSDDGGETAQSYTGFVAGKKVWEIKLGDKAVANPVIVNGTPELQVQRTELTKGDAVTKSTAKDVIDYYDFNGKKLKTVDGVQGSAVISTDGDEDVAVSSISEDADADGPTGYNTTNNGIYYSNPEADKTFFLTDSGWKSVAGGFQSTPYGENAYLSNRLIAGYNETGFLTDDYSDLDHQMSSDPSYLRFITYDGKVLWSVKRANGNDASGDQLAEVYGDVAHLQYTAVNADNEVIKNVDEWVNIETGKPVDAATVISTVKPYTGFNLASTDKLVSKDGVLALRGSYDNGNPGWLTFSSTGQTRALSESGSRPALQLDGVIGNVFYGAEGLRYDAATDKATVAKNKAAIEPAVVVDGGAYFTDESARTIVYAKTRG